jgi:drug/metabolite transporter (DMT)-like permease
MNTTIIFICIFYVVFAGLFMYGNRAIGIKEVSIHILYIVLSFLFGWILLPIELGRKLN